MRPASVEARLPGVGKAFEGILRLMGLLFVGFAIVGVTGCGGGDSSTTTAQAPSENDSTEGDGGAPPTPGLQMSAGGPMGAPGGAGGPMMGGMGSMGGPMAGPMGGPMGAPMAGGGGGQPAGAGPKVTAKPPNARPDPFSPWWSVVPPPPPAITLVEPYRIATRETGVKPPEEKVEVQEVPNRRVAGIATGSGVYALVEGPEGQTVVKAGDTLGDYRVESIRSRSIVLTRKVGNVSYTQEVPLTDVGSQRVAAGGPAGGPGGAGMMFRGGGAPQGGGGGGVGAETDM
jgi:hypothetical protein